MHKPTIFFDLDGTLIDNSVRWYRLHQKLAHEFGFTPVPQDEYLFAKRNHISEKQILTGKTSATVIEQYETKRLKLIEDPDYLQYDFIKPNIVEILTRLKKKYQLIIITKRKNSSACQKQLDTLGLRTLVDDLVIVGKGTKADTIKEKYSIEPGSIVVGDTEDDYYTAKNLQLPCWLVADGNRSKKFLQKLQSAQVLDTLSLDHDNIYP